MKITATGDRLNVLITCDYSPHHDWMAFAAWYSVYRNLPDADISILCSRNLSSNAMTFNWPFRCGVRFFQHENVGKTNDCLPLNKLYATSVALREKFVEMPLLVIEQDTMALRPFARETLDQLNDPDVSFGIGDHCWYFQSQDLERFAAALNTFGKFSELDDEQQVLEMIKSSMGEPEFISNLCRSSDEHNLATFSYYDTCGSFQKDDWTNRHLMECPFRYTTEFSRNVKMTADERQIIELWDQMKSTYDMVK